MLINAGNKQLKKKDTVNTQHNKYWWNDQCARATEQQQQQLFRGPCRGILVAPWMSHWSTPTTK